MTTTMQDLEPTAEALAVTWSDGSTSRFPWLWLRDHCPCPECLHAETLQRLVDTVQLPADLQPSHVARQEDGEGVQITWPHDHHVSPYPAAFLHARARPQPAPRPQVLWDNADFADGHPSADYEAVMAGNEGLLALLEAIERHGFAFVAPVPVELEATRDLAERIGYIRKTVFGDLWDFTADLKHSDTAYTNLDIGLHTDGTYALDPPGLQMFHCLHFDGTGGESVLANGFKAAQTLRITDPSAFELLTRIRVPAQYIEAGVQLRARHPVIGLDEDSEVRRVCYNNHDRAPFLPRAGEAAAFMNALRAFGALVAEPGCQQRFTLEPGRVLIFDNWRVLHARTAYEGKRHLAGCYLNREDFESRLRVLRP